MNKWLQWLQRHIQEQEMQMGVAMVTSGPGATNLITGIVGAWYDCIPAIYITGQVRTWEMTNQNETLQDGFQEVDICSQVKNVTKYAKNYNQCFRVTS